ncbi:MAG: NAD-dependent epimerase/dehydratase family protein, partial [Candidatus Eisenbacteria bacterium]|nr:NAD-dependent epimerase/dehydratase family protein [Candidatus Latescibacterota bacterium]MBD3301575.1 NAD-dependent epimerase/dehydratase family protein [Candidatus Eisenbacteria bacterium]
LGTDSVLRAARETRPDSLVLFSSSEVYGRTEGGAVSEEAVTVIGPTTVPRWSYAAGKAVGEYLALAEHRRHELPVTIVRCFNTCGPRQIDAYGMVLPAFLQQAISGRPLTVYGDGRQTRCFSYVGDVVRGVLALSRATSARGEVFNIGCDEEISILDLARRVRDLCGSRSEIRMVPYRQAYGDGFEEVPRRVPDLAKIRRWIDYRPEVGTTRLLEITRDWVRERQALDPSIP